MLDLIRSSAQSFGVKLAFGLIILVFVFWGVGNFNDRDYTNVVAVVNGQPILAIEFEKAYQKAEEYILRSNPNLTREQLTKDHLGRQVLRDLIQQTLLMQEAERGGINISPLEMRQHVEQIKAFQDDKGKFSPEVYKRVLEAQRLTPGQFENDLRNELLQEKMFALITAPAWADPDEARHRYNFLREKRLIDYLFFPSTDFINQSVVNDEAINDWYESHKADFAIPATIDLSYISLSPADLTDKDKISPQAIEAWYEENKSHYKTKDMVKASHILVPVAADADESAKREAREKIENIKQEIQSGKAFAEAADEYNQQGAAGKGGELGWISRGETVPPFEEAVFAAQPGEISEIVETPFGLHIILVEEKKSAGFKALEEVREEVKNAIAIEEGADKIHDALDSLVEDNILQKPLEESAAKFGLKVQHGTSLSKDELQDKLSISASDAAALINTPAGSPLDTAIAAGDAYLVARVNASKPEGIKPLAEVRDSIEKDLKAQEALKLAAAHAQNVLKNLQGKPQEQWGDFAKGLKKSLSVERQGPITDLGLDPSLSEDIFATNPGNWLSEPHLVHTAAGDGAALVFVEELEAPSQEEFKNVESILQNAILQDRKEALFSLFLQHLADGAKIELTNQRLVERTGH